MTRDDVSRLARQAGYDWELTVPDDRRFLERFAALVASHEREACAKVCDLAANYGSVFRKDIHSVAEILAKEIRARGNDGNKS